MALEDEAKRTKYGNARTDDWITTEYNNQSVPGTFATLGPFVVLGGDGLPLVIKPGAGLTTVLR